MTVAQEIRGGGLRMRLKMTLMHGALRSSQNLRQRNVSDPHAATVCHSGLQVREHDHVDVSSPAGRVATRVLLPVVPTCPTFHFWLDRRLAPFENLFSTSHGRLRPLLAGTRNLGLFCSHLRETRVSLHSSWVNSFSNCIDARARVSNFNG